MQPLIHIVDDEPGMRRSLELLLKSEMYRVATYGCSESFLQEGEYLEPGCIVIDVNLGQESGFDLQREMEVRRIVIPTIVISAHGIVPNVVQAVRRGAINFLEKPFSDAEFLEHVAAAVDLDIRAPHPSLEVRRRVQTLSPRERQVLELLVAGRNTKAIARQFGVSPQTIDKHRYHLLEKMQVDSVVELVQVVPPLSH